jgi:hypothetical protein
MFYLSNGPGSVESRLEDLLLVTNTMRTSRTIQIQGDVWIVGLDYMVSRDFNSYFHRLS